MDVKTTPPPKYFRPAKEDIHIGYEIESYEWSMDEAGDPALNYDRWVPVKLEQPFVQTILQYGVNGIRVPYLTDQQIVDEGWEKTFDNASLFNKKIEDYTYFISHNDEHKIEMSKIKDLRNDSSIQLFNGKCPSINEFRFICKLIGV